MVLQLLPGGAPRRILLHGLAKELEARYRDLDVLWPRPRTLLDFTIEQLQGHLVRCFLSHIEDEHACQHLIENDADGPHIDFVTVTLAPTPVRLNLFGRHH